VEAKVREYPITFVLMLGFVVFVVTLVVR